MNYRRITELEGMELRDFAEELYNILVILVWDERFSCEAFDGLNVRNTKLMTPKHFLAKILLWMATLTPQENKLLGKLEFLWNETPAAQSPIHSLGTGQPQKMKGQ